VPYVATALLTLLFCSYEFDLRHQNFRIPMRFPSVDYLMSATIVKGVMQHGWYTTNPMVGAPQGLDFHDFPMAEGLHFVFYQIAGMLRVPVVVAMNLHYILGYVLIALTSLYVFLALRLPLAPSIAAALLFAFMPHHWMPAQSHLMLSSYYMIPLTVLVILWLAQGEELVQGSRFRYRLTRRGVAAAIICALTGSGGLYYAVFGLAFLAIMTIFRLARNPSLSQALSGLMPLTFIGAFLLLNMSPSILYWMHHGVNRVVARRMPVEADIYGLKMAQLLLPVVNHRIPLLAHWKSSYLTMWNRYIPNNDLTATLGVVASFGFLALVAWLVFGKSDDAENGGLLTHLSILNISALLIATIGGFGSLFAFVVSPQIRVYSRISIYIAFFSLCAVLILIRRLPSKAFRFLAAVVMFAGLWDITPATLAPTPAFLAGILSDREFIHSIEAAVPRGSMIYQLPYHPFPEHGFTNKMQDYDPFRGYIYSDDLRWSYGAMEGRPADDWQKRVASLPVQEMLDTIAAAGFKGVYVDTMGYADKAENLTGRFRGLLGVIPVRSADQRFIFFPMKNAAN
jgi:phosphoglycerol transferase